jgi:hypothetical protein
MEITFRKTTAEREDALNQGPKHKGFLSAIEICEAAEEEEETARAESKCRDKPLQLVGRNPKILTHGWKSNGCGRVRCIL